MSDSSLDEFLIHHSIFDKKPVKEQIDLISRFYDDRKKASEMLSAAWPRIEQTNQAHRIYMSSYTMFAYRTFFGYDHPLFILEKDINKYILN